jgi:Mg-chelatase subunit ChlD
MLWALSAVAVPLLIHLWQKRRVVEVPFSTLRFLKVVAARTSRSAKVEHLLLLLLRSGIVVLVALAAARPVASQLSAQFFGGQVARAVVLVVDQSFSMGYEVNGATRLQAAIEQARTIIDDLRPGDSVAVLGATDRTKSVLPELTVDHAVARKALEGIVLTEGRSDFGPVLLEARKTLSRNPAGERQIIVLTDPQAQGWMFDAKGVIDADWTASGVKLIVVRTDETAAPNASLLGVQFDSPYASAGGTMRGMASVANFSAVPLQELFELKSGEERLVQRAVDVPAGSRLDVPFEFQIPAAVTGKWLPVAASLSGDRLKPDDKRYAVLHLTQPPRILVVETGDAPERAKPGFFLRKAFLAGSSPAPVKTVKPEELEELNLDAFSAVFVLGVPSLSDRAGVRVDRYLEGGGCVAVFPGESFQNAAWEKVEWMPAVAGERRDLPAERLPSLLLEPQHPLFNSWDASTPFPALPQKRVLSWKPRPKARALVSMGQGIPFLMYGERGAGKVIVVNATADLAWGGFPVSPAFLPVVQEIGRLSSARSAGGKAFSVGDPVPLPGGIAKDQALNVRLPSGETLVAPAGQPLLEEAPSAGLYEVSSAKEGVVARFAVNVDGAEGDLNVEAPDALEKRLPHTPLTGLEALQGWLERSRGLAPLWPLLLVLASVLFGVECVYSNLLARNRGQGDEGAIKTGRLAKRRFGQGRAVAAEGVEP